MPEGVSIEDIKKGKGRKAKVGDEITIHFVNQLEDGTVVGRMQAGDGRVFILGQNDQNILRAWDIGIPGMKVGAQRKIICPSVTAYGQAGIPPIIPSNATIISFVELRSIR